MRFDVINNGVAHHAIPLAGPILAGALALSGCGGRVDNPVTAAPQNTLTYSLVVSATKPVAGLQWQFAASWLPDVSQMQAHTAAALGNTTRILQRQGHSVGQTVTTDWLVFAPNSRGNTGWILMQKKARQITDLPVPRNLLCADAQGNPEDSCTLAWKPS